MKGAVLIVCGLVGGTAGGFLTHALSGDPAPGAQRTTRSNASNDAELAELRDRVKTLEEKLVRRQPETSRPARVDAPGEATGTAAPTKRPAGEKEEPKDVKALVAALIGKDMTHNASNRLFGWMTLHKDKIDATIRAIEKAAKADPNNPELQVALATAYVAKLTNATQQGPQQGLVWSKASKAYDAAIKLKPEHWQARFGKAFGVSMAPEFLGLKPVAIKQFEELKKIQERRAPEPHHAQTYFRLGSLYKNMGNVEKARDVWDQGIARFPEDKTLKGAMEASTTR